MVLLYIGCGWMTKRYWAVFALRNAAACTVYFGVGSYISDYDDVHHKDGGILDRFLPCGPDMLIFYTRAAIAAAITINDNDNDIAEIDIGDADNLV